MEKKTLLIGILVVLLAAVGFFIYAQNFIGFSIYNPDFNEESPTEKIVYIIEESNYSDRELRQEILKLENMILELNKTLTNSSSVTEDEQETSVKQPTLIAVIESGEVSFDEEINNTLQLVNKLEPVPETNEDGCIKNPNGLGYICR